MAGVSGSGRRRGRCYGARGVALVQERPSADLLHDFHDTTVSGRRIHDLSPSPPPPTERAPYDTMAHQDDRPTLPSLSLDPPDEEHHSDPFHDRHRQINFAEPRMPTPSTQASTLTPSQSVVSFPNEFGTLDTYDDEEEEKQPLNSGAGMLYPPS